MLTLLFLSAGGAKADELIRCTPNETSSSGTIIRHYTRILDVACYHSPYGPFFMLYKNGTPVSNIQYLYPMDTICDFEIYNDTVFFCGKGNVSRAGSGVVGYFAVADLIVPSPATVYYIALPAMETVKALEVGWFASRRHVVGVGEAINSEGMMVDLIDETAYWNVNLGDVGGDTIRLSDLAIIQSKVVVTSTKRQAGILCPGRLWYIDKPTTAGASLFPGNVFIMDHDHAGSKYLIKSMSGDYFFTAYHRSPSMSGSNPFVISHFSGTTCSSSVVIDEASPNMIYLGDINYTRGSWIVNLLVYGVYQTESGPKERSVIYELNYSSLPSSVKAHVYDGVFFESIDHVWVDNIDDQHFVMSGYRPYGYGIPYFGKYHSLYFDGSCLGKKVNDVKDNSKMFNERIDKIKNTKTLQIPVVIPATEKSINVETKCFSETHSPVYKDK